MAAMAKPAGPVRGYCLAAMARSLAEVADDFLDFLAGFYDRHKQFAGQMHTLIRDYGRHRRPVARSM